LYLAFLAIFLVTGSIGGVDTTGNIRHVEVRENSLFIEVETLKYYQNTLNALLAVLIFPK
jgi:hypothetical protein